MERKYKKGWLDRQFKEARETLASLPSWLREEVQRSVDRYYEMKKREREDRSYR